jgi:dihydrolipoamide dehydrogenase
MACRKVDVAILGAGTAGLSAYSAAKKYTDNLLIIESNQHGTTCARVGCMPSKLLIAAADYAHCWHKADIFGVSYSQPEINGKAVMQRLRNERDKFVDSVIQSVNQFPEHHKVNGLARFIDDNELEVQHSDGSLSQVQAERIIIATGSSSFIPDFLKAAESRLLISDDIFEWQDLPSSIAIFGPGVIGLEIGQALSRLGVKVAVFGKSGKLAVIQDPAISSYADAEFNREFYLDLNAEVKNIRVENDSVAINYCHREKGLIEEKFDYVLAATGRRPNLESLMLQNTRLELDEKGIPLYNPNTGQCGCSSIFIAGDASSDVPLLHEAVDEGKIAGHNAGRSLRNPDDIRAQPRRTALSIVFTDPQIISVGETLETIKKNCNAGYAIGEVSFEDQGRAKVINSNRGLLRVYGEQGSGLLLGAEMFGPAAEHIAHQLAWVIQLRLSVQQILELPFYHPVLEEGVRTALRNLNQNLHMGISSGASCLDSGPGA